MLKKLEICAVVICAVVALGLGGCWSEGKAPVVHACKAYDNEAACVADTLCQWKAASADKLARCKAK